MSKLMTESVDKNLRSFVRSYVNSLVAWAIIVFFYQNPGARNRVSDLARHLGRREDDVEKAVGHLIAKGLLKKDGVGDDAVYFYEPIPDLHKQVETFVNLLEKRELRLWVLGEVLK